LLFPCGKGGCNKTHTERIEGTPSWSWISVNGAIKYDSGWQYCRDSRVKSDKPILQDLELITADIRRSNDDSHGQVSYAAIEVEGSFAPLKFSREFMWVDDNHTKKILMGSCISVGGLSATFTLDFYGIDLELRVEQKDYPEYQVSPDCIVVGHRYSTTKKGLKSIQIYLLVLEKTERNREYRRIGIAEISRPSITDAEVQDWLKTNFGKDSRKRIILV
jgi:hypothetical protein